MSRSMRVWQCRAFGACCVAIVAGCAGIEPPAATSQAHQPQIATVELVHTVYFDTDDARLTTAEAEALRRFARQIEGELSLEQIVIGHADIRGSDTHNDPLSERRTASVVLVLEAEGLPAERISRHALGRRIPVAADDPATSLQLSRRVEVLARGLVVVEPSCPDWSRPSAAHPANLPTSNFGCATAVNLVRMVADQRDLVRGQALGPADSHQATAAVERYRADDVKPLTVEGASR